MMETSGRGAAGWAGGAAHEERDADLECRLPISGGRLGGPPGLGSGRTHRRRCQRKAQLAWLRQLAAPATPPATGAFAGGVELSPVKGTAAQTFDKTRDTKDSWCDAQQFPSGNPIDFVLEFIEELEIENEGKAVWINQLNVGCVQRSMEALDHLVGLAVVEVERGAITSYIAKDGNKVVMERVDSDPEYEEHDSESGEDGPGSDSTWEAGSSEEAEEGGPSGLCRPCA